MSMSLAVSHHLVAWRVSRFTGQSFATDLLPRTWSQHSAVQDTHLLLERHARRWYQTNPLRQSLESVPETRPRNESRLALSPGKYVSGQTSRRAGLYPREGGDDPKYSFFKNIWSGRRREMSHAGYEWHKPSVKRE